MTVFLLDQSQVHVSLGHQYAVLDRLSTSGSLTRDMDLVIIGFLIEGQSELVNGRRLLVSLEVQSHTECSSLFTRASFRREFGIAHPRGLALQVNLLGSLRIGGDPALSSAELTLTTLVIDDREKFNLMPR